VGIYTQVIYIITRLYHYVVLIGAIGGLTIATIVALWAYVKLTKWSLSVERDLNTEAVAGIWRWFVAAVLLVELGPGIAQATVTALQWIL